MKCSIDDVCFGARGTKRNSGWLLCAFLGVLIFGLLGFVSNAWAASYFFAEKPVEMLITLPTTDLFLSYELEQEHHTGPEYERRSDHITKRLRLAFRSQGWIYHPALVKFSVDLRPQFIWKTWQRDTTESKRDEKMLGYSIVTNWLSAKPYNLVVGSQRRRSEYSAATATDVVNVSRSDHVTLNFSQAKLPTKISYRDQTTDSEGFFSTSNESKRWQVTSALNVGDHQTRLVAQREEFVRRIKGSENWSEQQGVFLTDNYKSPNGNMLTSSFRVTENTSRLTDSTRIGLTSSLRLRHRDNLSTSYNFNFTEIDERQYSADTKSMSAVLTHRLYENLTTSLHANGSKAVHNSGELNSYGGGLNFAYSRRIPWGVLSVGLGGGERVSDDQRVAVFAETRDESHTFVGISTQIILDHLNIDVDSISIRNTSGQVTYVRGIDYEVQIQGRAVVIVRDIFAGIADDETVLVDYRFAADLPAKTGVSTVNSSLGLVLWQKLSLSYSRNRVKQRLIDGAAPATPISHSGTRFSASFQFKRSRTRFTMEDRDSTVIPMKGWTFDQSIDFGTSHSVSWGLSASISEFELKDTGNKTRQNRLNANLSWRGRERKSFRTQVFFGNVQSEDRHTREKGLSANYDWVYGAWRPQIRYQFSEVVNAFADEARDRQSIYFDVSRSFR
jgi:hypothetical protein